MQFRELLIPALAGHFRQSATDEWIERLRAAGVPCGPVNDIPTALETPQAEHRQMVQTLTDGYGDRIRLVGPVPKLDRTPAQISRPPPLLGEHTNELLQEKLDLTESEIQALHDNGVV